MKRVFPWFPIDGKIYIQRCGSVLEINDHNGFAGRLLALLDGTRTCAEVQAELVGDFPEVSVDDVAGTVAQLDAERIVEDGSVVVPDDPYVLQRGLRDLGFFETYSTLAVSKYELHRRVRECKVVILGVGGVGSHVLYDLLGLGIRDIRAVDYDKVELSNLNRQIFYRESDIGRIKTVAIAERASEYAPRAKVETVEMRVASADDVYGVVADRDIAVVTIDQPKMNAVQWANEGCVRAGTVMLAGGVDMQRSIFYTVVPGQSGCVECWRAGSAARDPVSALVSAEMARIEPTLPPGERFGQDMAAFGPLVTCHTASIVTELVRVATGIVPPVATGRSFEVRFDDFTVREFERWDRLPDCPVCGDAAGAARAGEAAVPEVPGSYLEEGHAVSATASGAP